MTEQHDPEEWNRQLRKERRELLKANRAAKVVTLGKVLAHPDLGHATECIDRKCVHDAGEHDPATGKCAAQWWDIFGGGGIRKCPCLGFRFADWDGLLRADR